MAEAVPHLHLDWIETWWVHEDTRRAQFKADYKCAIVHRLEMAQLFRPCVFFELGPRPCREPVHDANIVATDETCWGMML